MNKSVLMAAGVNCDSGLKRFMGNEQLYEKMLLKFLEDTGVSDAQAALAAKDYDALYFCIHNLKGTSGNLSLTSVYDSSVEVLSLLRNKTYDGLSESLDKLGALHQKAIQAIDDACNNLSGATM